MHIEAYIIIKQQPWTIDTAFAPSRILNKFAIARKRGNDTNDFHLCNCFVTIVNFNIASVKKMFAND